MANHLTFASAEPFTLESKVGYRTWAGTLYYSTDAENWNEWKPEKIASAEHGGEQKIYMRGIGNEKISQPLGASATLALTGTNVRCIGNIETLLDYEKVANGEHPSMAGNCFKYLFRDCTSLTQAPELPATTLAAGCYFDMFFGCTSLTQAPELPATALTNDCYRDMFYGCTSLTQAPELPATTLAKSCYSGMFEFCTSLTQAPELPATTLAASCYAVMFNGCTALKQAPELPATELVETCYYGMFSHCTSLVAVPILPATMLVENCYYMMFSGCTGIKLSETQTSEYSLEYRIPTIGTGMTATDALKSMFYGTGGTFTGTPEINTSYYLAVPVPISLDPQSLTAGWLVGKKIAAMRGKV